LVEAWETSFNMRLALVTPEGEVMVDKQPPTPEVTHEAWSIADLSRIAAIEADKASTKVKVRDISNV
jgi:hypothetical protein